MGLAAQDNNSAALPVVKALIAAGIDCNNNRDGSPLVLAATASNWQFVRMLMESAGEQCDVHQRNEQGRSILALAAGDGENAIVDALLSVYKVYIDGRDSEGNTALMMACQNGHQSTVELLLTRGARATAQNKMHLTPLAVGAMHGHTHVMLAHPPPARREMLMTANMSISPIVLAAKHHHWKVVAELLTEIDRLNAESEDIDAQNALRQLICVLLPMAACDQQWNLVMSWLENRVNTMSESKDADSCTILWVAKHNQWEIACAMLDKTCTVDLIRIDDIGNNVLAYAAMMNQWNTFKVLVERLRADGMMDAAQHCVVTPLEDQKSVSVLTFVAQRGLIEQVRYLLNDVRVHMLRNKGDLVTSSGPTKRRGRRSLAGMLSSTVAAAAASQVAQHISTIEAEPAVVAAVSGGFFDIANFLLKEHNAMYPPDCINRQLLNAVIERSVDKVTYLIGRNADVNTMDDRGSALRLAIGNLPVMEVLVRGGVDINAPCGSNGCPVQFEVVESGNIEMLQYLVQNGADLNVVDSNNGRTLLIAGAQHGQYDMMVALVNDYRLVLDTVDSNGASAVLHAARHQYWKIVEMLLLCRYYDEQ